ncbi:MAG: hypothetical protein ACRDN0_17210 [Trebonia sp.]
MLTVACAVCAAAIAALPGPAAPANGGADAAKIVSALSLVPQAVTSYDKTVKDHHKACARPVTLPPVALKLAAPRNCAARAGGGRPAHPAGKAGASG